MVTLRTSTKWKDDFRREMYCNDDEYFKFIQDDIVRAYYFGFFLQDTCKELEYDGFKTSPVEEQVVPLRWDVRRHKYQIQFWKKKYIELNGDRVILTDLDAYILNKIVIDSYDDLLKIATLLGRDSYLTIATQKSE